MSLNFPATKSGVWDGGSLVLHQEQQTPLKELTTNPRKPGVWSDIRCIVRLLRVTGIHLPANSRGIQTWPLITSALGMLLFVLCLSFIASEVAFCGVTGFVGSSVVICMTSTLCLSFLLWITLLKTRKKFARLIDRSGTFCDFVTVGDNSKLRRYTKVAACYVFFAPMFASLSSAFSIQNDDDYYYLHCYLFGNPYAMTEDSYKDVLLLFFLTIENYMQLFLPNLVTVLIVYLYEHLSGIVLAFVHKCNNENWRDYCLVHHSEAKNLAMLELYKKIRKNYDLLLELSSLPIFLIISQKFLTLFFTLTVILSSKKKKILIQLIEGCFLALNAMLTLVLIILSGSRIRESHSKVRQLLLEMTEFLDSRRCSSKCEVLPLLKTFVEKDDMVMIAAGMIPLTRSLFLKIGAALVTYGVLIVQLDTSDDP